VTTKKNNSAPLLWQFGVRTFLGPVIHEESIKACPERSRRVGGATKAPDYYFRIGGRRALDPTATRGYIDSEEREVKMSYENA
jgi:hypothetical protein